tara:strand:- start:11428 stop:12330 length:903 start_codon:yes stop_codon:yes gene_type:complete
LGFVLSGGNPAVGAAIGRAIGSAASGRNPRQIARDAFTGYAIGSFGTGAGLQGGKGVQSLNPFGQDFLLKPSNIVKGGVPATSDGIGSLFQDLGAGIRGADVNIFGKEGRFANLSGIQKGILGLGLLEQSGLLKGGEEEGGPLDKQLPPEARSYFSGGLQPANLPTSYGGQPIEYMGMSVSDQFGLDRVLSDLVSDIDYASAGFPTFPSAQLNAGGIARLADGGDIPEVDLRKTGGDIDDPKGAGNKDTVPALLADGEFVMTKQSVAGIGGGDHDKGIARMYDMMEKAENKAKSMGIGRA